MPRTLLAPSLSLSQSLNARHRLTCSWNSVGSFYADNAVPYGGHIRPAFALVRGLILSAQGNGLLSCWIGVLPTDSGAGTASGSCCCCWHLFGDIVIDIKRALFHPQFHSMLSVQVVKASPSASVAHISNTTNSARLPFSFSLFVSLSQSFFPSLSLSNDRFFWVSGSAAGSKSVARCLVVGLWTLFGIINVCASAFGFAWNSLTTCNYLILLFVLRCR